MKALSLSLVLFASIAPASATYSIVAVDPMTGQCGVAVQTDNLAVGSSVPYAKAGVGAIASQYETNPRHGPRGLQLLADGKSPAETLKQLLAEDGNFDGRGTEARQLAIVSLDGRAAVHTGTDAAQSEWAGSRSGQGYSIQGNGLASSGVVEAMEHAYLTTTGSLAERLLAALSAGDRSGGQRTGRESAALLVRTRDGFPLDIDLRVDHSDDPVGDLRRLLDLQLARQQVIDARNAGRRDDLATAHTLLSAALTRGDTWPRLCVLAADVALELDDLPLATDCLNRAFTKNPARAAVVLAQGDYAVLGADPQFHRWITPAAEQAALALAKTLEHATTATTEEKFTAARRLLEAGHARESLALIDATETSSVRALLRTAALESLGELSAAIEECERAQNLQPDNLALKRRLKRLQSSNSAASAHP